MNLERFPRNQEEQKDPSQDLSVEDRAETEALEALAERLKLKEQYLSQVRVLYKSGILENFAVDPEQGRYTPEMGIIGIDGQEYILPSYEDLLERLKDPEKRKLIEKKADQGFAKLQLVPFAMPLTVLIQRYKEVLLKTHKESGIKSTDSTKLELNTEDPLYVWEDLLQCDNPETSPDKQMEYGVTTYDAKTKEARGGKYKSELLNENPTNAWHITLIEDLPDLPAENQGQTISGRKQIEPNKSSKQYLQEFQTNPQYQSESGQTPEEALTTWLTYLQEKKTAIDDYQGQGKINWLVGQYLSGRVPNFHWNRGSRQPALYGDIPVNSFSNNGCRPSASV